MATHIDRPFRFLDLPPELRLMVYENLEFTTTHTLKRLRRRKDNRDDRWKTAGDLTLVVKFLSVSILATCQAINSEATPIMDRRLARLRSEPLRLVIDVSGIDFDFESYEEVMWRLAKHMERVREYQDDQISQGEPYDLLRAHLIECYCIPISSADSFQHILISAVDSLWHFIVTATSQYLSALPLDLQSPFSGQSGMTHKFPGVAIVSFAMRREPLQCAPASYVFNRPALHCMAGFTQERSPCFAIVTVGMASHGLANSVVQSGGTTRGD
jgi:hypothetical protein